MKDVLQRIYRASPTTLNLIASHCLLADLHGGCSYLSHLRNTLVYNLFFYSFSVSVPFLERANSHPAAMATAAAGATQPMAKDAVPAAEGPAQLKPGYRLEIFEKREDREKYACGFCGKIVREPVQAECGHRFCANCKAAIEE